MGQLIDTQVKVPIITDGQSVLILGTIHGQSHQALSVSLVLEKRPAFILQ